MPQVRRGRGAALTNIKCATVPLPLQGFREEPVDSAAPSMAGAWRVAFERAVASQGIAGIRTVRLLQLASEQAGRLRSSAPLTPLPARMRCSHSHCLPPQAGAPDELRTLGLAAPTGRSDHSSFESIEAVPLARCSRPRRPPARAPTCRSALAQWLTERGSAHLIKFLKGALERLRGHWIRSDVRQVSLIVPHLVILHAHPHTSHGSRLITHRPAFFGSARTRRSSIRWRTLACSRSGRRLARISR